jgi:hypothetical protein
MKNTLRFHEEMEIEKMLFKLFEFCCHKIPCRIKILTMSRPSMLALAITTIANASLISQSEMSSFVRFIRFRSCSIPSAGVSFINVIRAAFKRADPESKFS